MSSFYSMKQALKDMDYPMALPSDATSLRDRPMRARTGYLSDPFAELGHHQADQVDAFIGMQVDAHARWYDQVAVRDYPRNLAWRKWYRESMVPNDPTQNYPGQVELKDQGTHWSVKTRVDGDSPNFPLGMEVWSMGKLEESGRFRITGRFDDIKWNSFSNNSLRVEEFHIYVSQSDAGYMAGTTEFAFAWQHNQGGDAVSSDPNAIADFPRELWPETVDVDYEFDMTVDKPYVVMLLRQLSRVMPSDEVSKVFESTFRDFKIERIA